MTRICVSVLICVLTAASIAPALSAPSSSHQDASFSVQPLRTNEAGLVAHWPLDASAGSVAVNVASGLNGTIHGASPADGCVGDCL